MRDDEYLEDDNSDAEELKEELEQHFPLSGNETDEDLDRVLHTGRGGNEPDRDQLTEEDTDRHFPLSGNETDEDL